MVSNSVNFGSRPLHNVNLRRGAGEGFVRAVVSELDPKDPQDIEALQKIADSWHGAKYAREMLLRFLDTSSSGQKYYSVELPEKNTLLAKFLEKTPLHKRILGYAKTHLQNTYNLTNLDFSLVQTKPDAMFDNAKREIKGVGETLLGQAFRQAKELEASCLTITSVNDIFYNKTFKAAGVEVIDERIYDNTAPLMVDSGEFDTYLSYIKEKY